MDCYCRDQFKTMGKDIRKITFYEFKVVDWERYISEKPVIVDPLAHHTETL
jgi:hypothetical protein